MEIIGLCQGSKQYHGASQIIYLKYINFSFMVYFLKHKCNTKFLQNEIFITLSWSSETLSPFYIQLTFCNVGM